MDNKDLAALIRALLGAPPPRVWNKWPNLYAKAEEAIRELEKGQ